MRVSVNRLTNANLYVNGTSLLGMAEEIKIPGIKAKTEDHKGLGRFGTAEFPSGAEKLEATVKWVSIYLEAELQNSGMFQVNQYQARGNIETYGPTGLLAQTPGIWLFSASLKDSGPVTFKQHQNVDKTTTLTVYHIEQYVGGVQTLLYDVLANIYVVNGKDQLAQFRANLGG